MIRFHKDDRVQMSAHGLSQGLNARHPNRHGRVTVNSRGVTVAVLWDGTKSSRQYHHSMLQQAVGESVLAVVTKRKKKKSNAAIIRERKIIRSGFDIIRHDPAKKIQVDRLAKALGGNSDLWGTALREAKIILAAAPRPEPTEKAEGER